MSHMLTLLNRFKRTKNHSLPSWRPAGLTWQSLFSKKLPDFTARTAHLTIILSWFQPGPAALVVAVNQSPNFIPSKFKVHGTILVLALLPITWISLSGLQLASIT
ncbi:MAG TPA: hypothetical protein VEC96_07910 [Anaerolineae bacterium]|nr:hypothetical protein [Anaerolineae bacterium]